MGTINQGILGGFSGRVGNVIGSSWKGKSIMKIRPASVSNPNTERQQQQRLKFNLVGRFNQAHRNLVRIGFRAYTKNMTAANAAMSYNLANAVTGDFPDLSIDFSKAAISLGNLASVDGASAISESPSNVTLNWIDNSQASNASASDQLMVSFYEKTTNTAVYFPGCASRQESTVILNLPAKWSGQILEVMLFLISIDGKYQSSDPETVSNTVYAGSVEVM